MAAFVLVHGAGSTSWYWHRVVPLLEAAGHDAVAVDLPCDDDSAGLDAYAAAIVDAAGGRRGIVLVAQSLAGFSAPLVCGRASVSMLVLLNAMIPNPGERAAEWWRNTGQPQAMVGLAGDGRSADELMNDAGYLFLHDLPADVAAASAGHVRNQSGRPFGDPWPLEAWPDVETRILVGREDRLFPADFQDRVARQRLGRPAERIGGGHLAALSRPGEVAEALTSS
jgi:pimeloyl-ACP methyl ester carboxylesterase